MTGEGEVKGNEERRVRRYNLLLSTLGLILVLAGLALRRGELLLLALPFIIYLTAGIWLSFTPEELKLKATRWIAPRQVFSGEEVQIEVELRNEGRALAEVLLAESLPSPRLEVVEGELSRVVHLRPGERARLEYRVRAQRGRFRFEALTVRVADVLGLNCLELRVPAPGELLVTPRFEELRDITIAPRRTRVYSGVVKARIGGTGVEFFGTREYHYGDEFRWIDWNATARLGRLITAEFEQERVADVGLILDARARANVVVDGDSLFEYSVQAAASLARYFIKEGNRVGLLIYGRYLDWTYPGYGRVQLMKLLEALTRAETGDKVIFEGLENIPRRLFPAGSQLVLISPLLEEDVEVLRRLRALYSVIVVAPDPLKFELNRLREDRDEATMLAARLLRLRRELMLNQLREAKIRVADWDVDQPLKVVTKRALSRALR